MVAVVRAVLAALLLAHASASGPVSRVEDTTCALQTVRETQGWRDLSGQATANGVAPPWPLSAAAEVNSTAPQLVLAQQQAACSSTAQIHMFAVSYSQSVVRGGTRFTYTLTPTPAPKNANGISHIEFHFDACTCQSPDEFTDLEMLDTTSGSKISVSKACGPKGRTTKRYLKFDSVGDKKGSTYTVSYTLTHQNLDLGAVPMKIKAGRTEYFGNDLCGPICLPETAGVVVTESPTETPTLSPTESPTGFPTGSPSSSPTTSPTGSPTSSPSASPTGSPSSSPTSSPTGSPTSSPSSSPTGSPTLSPSASPTGSPSSSPTASPTGSPTSSPSASPTGSPSSSPTASPTGSPTSSPTASPTGSPTSSPSLSPTGSPSSSPTAHPTSSPSSSPTASPTGSPTSSPTASPTGSPTSSPSASPTSSPSSSPTASPTGSPTSSPTASPTGSPTSSPSQSPTGSPSSSPTAPPTASPTSSPSASPTGSPSSSPTASPTGSPSSSPTVSPTGSPSSSPTAPPTTGRPSPKGPPQPSPYGVATSFGDPHVSNLKGERFDILQSNYHTFLVVPRGADEKYALLHVRAKVDPLGPLCGGLLYVTGLKFSGSWLKEVGSLEFFTNVSAAMDAARAIRIKVGSSPYLNVSQFEMAAGPAVVSEVTELQPEEPQSLNQHVDTFRVKLMLGPAIAKVRMVYQKEKIGFSNSLWLTTTGLKHVQDEIGGILGVDGHEAAARAPRECARGKARDDGSAAAELLGSLPGPQSIYAEATLEDIE